MNEQLVIDKLTQRFPFMSEHIRSPKERRIMTDAMCAPEFTQVFLYAKDKLNFKKAHHVIGTDDGEYLGLIYVLSNEDHILLALRLKTPKSAPVVRSMTDVFPSLLWHERELCDLFGVDVRGLPEGPSYPLPDGWPKGNYPMRKEWDPKYLNKDTMTYEPPVTAAEAQNEQHK